MANLNLNKVVLGGRITADPEMRVTPTGIHTVGFSIAINGRGKNAQVDFIDIVAWRGLADTVCKYFKKGSSIVVTGRLSTRSWTDTAGIKRQKVEVVADDIVFVDGRNENTDSASADNNETETAVPTAEVIPSDEDGDSLPF